MSELSMERVREIAEEPSDGIPEQYWEMTPLTERRVLARMVLALTEALETERLRLAACGAAAVGAPLEGMVPEYESASLDDVVRLVKQVATLTAQRDEAVAVAREAVDFLWAVDECDIVLAREKALGFTKRLAALTTPTGGTE